VENCLHQGEKPLETREEEICLKIGSIVKPVQVIYVLVPYQREQQTIKKKREIRAQGSR